MTAPRPSCENIAAWLLTAAAFVFPTLAVIAPLGITVEFVILGVGLMPFVFLRRAWRLLPCPALALPATLVAWAMASMLWAEDPLQAGIAAIRLAGVFILSLSTLAAGLAIPTTAFRPFRIALLADSGLVAVARTAGTHGAARRLGGARGDNLHHGGGRFRLLARMVAGIFMADGRPCHEGWRR